MLFDDESGSCEISSQALCCGAWGGSAWAVLLWQWPELGSEAGVPQMEKTDVPSAGVRGELCSGVSPSSVNLICTGVKA